MSEQGQSKANSALMSRDAAELMERTIVGGDLSKLTPADRVRYVVAVCQSVGLNPLTKPFEYVMLQGRMVLYARKEATEQLRALRGVSITKLERQTVTDGSGDEYQMVTAYASDQDGRSDAAIGVVALEGRRGEERANRMMKAETKAKRRVTLSLCGLGVLDESEIDVPPGAVRTTEMIEVPKHPSANALQPDGTLKTTETHETGVLFTTPEHDRAGLIQRARIAVARIEKERVQAMKAEILGDADAKYETCDLAALVAFVQAVEEVRL